MNKNHMDTGIREQIDEYVNGRLSPKEVDELWVQLIQNQEHMDYMKSMANLRAVANKRSAEEAGQENSSNISYLYYAAAAVVALLIAVWGVMEFSIKSMEQSVSPIASVELQYYRSADGSLTNDAETDKMQQAITYASENQVNKAVVLLKEELSSMENVVERSRINLTLGSMMYNESQFQKAAEYFTRIIDQNQNDALDILTLEKAYWYRGNAYLQMNLTADARADIAQAYDYNGAYRRVAGRYLEALPE